MSETRAFKYITPEKVEEAPKGGRSKVEEPRVEMVQIRCTPKEKRMAEALAKYLHAVGKLDDPSISGAFRCSLLFLYNEILKGIERERFG